MLRTEVERSVLVKVRPGFGWVRPWEMNTTRSSWSKIWIRSYVKGPHIEISALIIICYGMAINPDQVFVKPVQNDPHAGFDIHVQFVIEDMD